MSEYFPPLKSSKRNIKAEVDISNYAAKADIKNITHIDTSSFVLKTNLANLKTEIDKLDIDKLVPVPTDLSKLSNVVKNDVVKKTDYNTKVADIEGKTPDVSNLAAKTALTAVENKIPDASSLVTKTALTTVENKILMLVIQQQKQH